MVVDLIMSTKIIGNEDSNRITIAYNIRPLKQLNPIIEGAGQFIPL
jgi:hypothetical protein